MAYFSWSLLLLGGNNFFNAIKSYGRGLALSDASGSSHIMAQRALCAMAFIMSNTGDFLGAKKHAIRAQEYAQYLGDVYAQAYASYTSQMSYDICGLSVCSSSLPTGHRSFGIMWLTRLSVGHSQQKLGCGDTSIKNRVSGVSSTSVSMTSNH
jgi:hypothetical protein